MPQAPTPSPNAAHGLAAIIGTMLRALLAALLGAASARRRALTRPGVTVVVLHAALAADMQAEPEVEWVAVPAPWRAGQLLPQDNRARRAITPHRALGPGTLARAPPPLHAPSAAP